MTSRSTTKLLLVAIACVAAIACKDNSNGHVPMMGGGDDAGDGGVPPGGPPQVRADSCADAPYQLLDCRTGAAPAWQQADLPLEAFNACLGSITVAIGGLVYDSAINTGKGQLAQLAPADDRDECGTGCALAAEATVVYVDGPPAMAIVLAGHDQMRFAWDDHLGIFVAEPYVEKDLVAITDTNGMIATLTSNFDQADRWLLYSRDGSVTEFRRFGGQKVWRVAEADDALAAMQKAAARAQGMDPKLFGSFGRTTAYRRDGKLPDDDHYTDGDGYLDEVDDYRQPGVIAVKFDRDPNTHRVTGISNEIDTASNDVGSVIQVAIDSSHVIVHVNSEAPYTLDLANGQVVGVTNPSGDVLKYSFGPDGRLTQVNHPAASQASIAGDTTTNIAYGNDCKNNQACTVTMTDQDGFAWAASFTKFAFSAQGTPDRFYTAAVIGPGGPANSIAYARAASGYLVSKASIGTTDSWTPGCGDGHPANKWTVERMDGPGTDPTKMTDSSKIEYIAQFFDNDNVPTKVITNSSEIDTTYQKTLHPDRKDAWWTTLGWAAQMPAEVDTKGFDANGGPMTTVEKIALSQGGTNGGAYTVTVTEPWTGGDAVTEYDQFSRVIASQGPGDVPGVWRTITYDQFGQVSKQVDNASEVDSVSYASGNRKSVTVTACGKQRLSVTATENQYKVINSTTIVVGDPNGKGSYTKSLGQDKFDTNGLAATTTLTTPVYSREEDRTFSLGVLTGVTQTTTVGGTPYTEQRAWHVRGY